MDSENTSAKIFGAKSRAGIAALILLRLWLTLSQKMALFPSTFDDLLFLKIARSLRSARWLGSYNNLILSKGPFFPFYIWAAFISGVPLYLALQIGYAISCVVLICALRPLCSSRAVLFAVFTVLLFNPVSYDQSMSHVVRQTLTPAMVLLIIASLVALHGNRNASMWKLLRWSLLLGVTFTAFWMNREDSIWLVPTAAVLFAIVAWDFWLQRRTRPLFQIILVLGLPFVVFCEGIGIVSFLNWHYYGAFTISEFRSKDFKDAYGALMRVKPDQWNQYIPVTRKTREQVYTVSPAFAELRPYLEGDLGIGWTKSSTAMLHYPVGDLEVAGGFWVWDLRDAVAMSGHAKNAREAMAFYRRIADEVNAACDRHLLDAGPCRSGFLPRLSMEYWVPFRRSFRSAFKCVFLFKGMDPSLMHSTGSAEDLLLFKDLTWNGTNPAFKENISSQTQKQINAKKISVLTALTHAYGKCAQWFGIASLCSLLASLVLGIRLRKFSYFSLLSLAMLGGCLALMVIVSLMDCSCGPSISCSYLCGDYDLYLLSIFTGFMALFETIRWTREKRATATSSNSTAS